MTSTGSAADKGDAKHIITIMTAKTTERGLNPGIGNPFEHFSTAC
jgi:hypothetical protein